MTRLSVTMRSITLLFAVVFLWVDRCAARSFSQDDMNEVWAALEAHLAIAQEEAHVAIAQEPVEAVVNLVTYPLVIDHTEKVEGVVYMTIDPSELPPSSSVEPLRADSPFVTRYDDKIALFKECERQVRQSGMRIPDFKLLWTSINITGLTPESYARKRRKIVDAMGDGGQHEPNGYKAFPPAGVIEGRLRIYSTSPDYAFVAELLDWWDTYVDHPSWWPGSEGARKMVQILAFRNQQAGARLRRLNMIEESEEVFFGRRDLDNILPVLHDHTGDTDEPQANADDLIRVPLKYFWWFFYCGYRVPAPGLAKELVWEDIQGTPAASQEARPLYWPNDNCPDHAEFWSYIHAGNRHPPEELSRADHTGDTTDDDSSMEYRPRPIYRPLHDSSSDDSDDSDDSD